jgi:hypothetical protein
MANDRCDPHCNTGGHFYRSSRILGQLKEEARKQKDLVIICTNPAAPPNTLRHLLGLLRVKPALRLTALHPPPPTL